MAKKGSNNKIQNSRLNHADLSSIYSDDLMELDDEADEYYGPSKVKTKKKPRYR